MLCIFVGTTLNLLEFPIVTPSPYRLYKRTERLLREREAIIEEQRLRKNMLRETGHKRYATLMGQFCDTETGYNVTLHRWVSSVILRSVTNVTLL